MSQSYPVILPAGSRCVTKSRSGDAALQAAYRTDLWRFLHSYDRWQEGLPPLLDLPDPDLPDKQKPGKWIREGSYGVKRSEEIISDSEKRNSSVGKFPDINLAGRQIVICVPQGVHAADRRRKCFRLEQYHRLTKSEKHYICLRYPFRDDWAQCQILGYGS